MVETTTNKKYTPLLTVRDTRFDIDQLNRYHLSIQVSDQTLKVSCVEPTTRKCLLLMTYRLAHGQAQHSVSAIEHVYREHPLLATDNWAAATLCVDNQQYTLVPERLFQAEKAAVYLDFACARGDYTVQHFVHPSLNVAIAFATEPALLHWFQTTYSKTPLCTIHQANSVIEGVWHYLKGYRLGSNPKIFAFVQPMHLHITAMQRGSLLYYNRFRYANSDELLHYILIVMRALKLDAGFHEVIVGGNMTKSSLAYKKARNYIRHLSLSSRLPYLQFRHLFKRKLTAHHLDVLSAHLCHPTRL